MRRLTATMPIFGSPESEWMLWFAVLHASWHCLSLALQWVSGCRSCYFSCLLTMPVLGSSESEWLLWFAVFQACWQCLFLTLQSVSGCAACCFSSLLTMPVLGSSVGTWLLWFAIIHYSNLLTMFVLGPSASEWLLCLLYFKPADSACPWLSKKWMAAVAYCVSSLLIMRVIHSLVGE